MVCDWFPMRLSNALLSVMIKYYLCLPYFFQICLILLLAQTSKFSSVSYKTKYSELRTISFHVSNLENTKLFRHFWSMYYILLHKNLQKQSRRPVNGTALSGLKACQKNHFHSNSSIYHPASVLKSKKHLECSQIVVLLFHKGVQTTKIKHWNQRINKENKNKWKPLEIQNVENKNVWKKSLTGCLSHPLFQTPGSYFCTSLTKDKYLRHRDTTPALCSRPCLPLSAVFVAQLAHFLPVCVFPHQAVVLSQHALWATGHTEQSILEVGTLSTISRALKVNKKRREVYSCVMRVQIMSQRKLLYLPHNEEAVMQ